MTQKYYRDTALTLMDEDWYIVHWSPETGDSVECYGSDYAEADARFSVLAGV